MPPSLHDAAFLWDMLQAAITLRDFARGRTLQDYTGDIMLRSAVERQIEIIGEAARKVSDSFQQQHPEIPWTGIVGQRHVLAHEYGEVDHQRIWKVVTDHIPQLIECLEPLIPNPPSNI